MAVPREKWGPFIWGAIHMICLGAPPSLDAIQQEEYRTFFLNLPKVLPCAECAEHLKQNLSKVPIDTALLGRDTLFEWSVNLHNVVNRMLGKPGMPLPKAKAFWMEKAKVHHEHKHNHDHGEKIGVLMIGIIIGALFMYGWNRVVNKVRTR